MRVYNIGLGFGAKSKNNESFRNSNIFLCALGGTLAGATGGVLARNYVPFGDEFSRKPSEVRREIEESLSNFADDYSLVEVQEARALKTALLQPDIAAHNDKKNLKIEALLKDESIKPVGAQDSEELQSTFKALYSQLSEEIKEAKSKNNLPEKLKNLDDMALNVHSKAQKAIFVRKNLKEYKEQIKGLAKNGKDTITSIKQKIEISKEGTAEMKQELGTAFDYMIKAAKNSQRPVEVWTIIPAIICGIAGMGLAVYNQLKKDKIDAKKEPA